MPRWSATSECPTCHVAVDGRKVYCSPACRPECVVEWFDKPVQGTQAHCNWHTEQLRRHGEIRPPKWNQEWVCIVCGAEVAQGSGRRKHCSTRCQMLTSLNPNRPTSFDCVKCGVMVSLIVPSTKTGQFKRSDSTLCDKCKNRTRSKMTVGELALRDGPDCGICGDPVDLSAPKTDVFRPSVDHVVPRAQGGTNDPSNLQLAHLWCNQVKNKRGGFTLRLPERRCC